LYFFSFLFFVLLNKTTQNNFVKQRQLFLANDIEQELAKNMDVFKITADAMEI